MVAQTPAPPPTALPALRLADVALRIHQVFTLPHVALRIMEVANDPDCSVQELKELLEINVALSTRVLRCVNSSTYAPRAKVTNLQHAVTYLGLKQIRNLVLTASVGQFFKGDQALHTYSRAGLWRHLVAVGIAARLLAKRLRLEQFEDVFLAGLLHDIGIVLEDQHLHKHFAAVVPQLHPAESLTAVERRYLGFDHTLLGETIAAQWKLPAPVVDAIRRHHDAAQYGGPHLAVVRCVELANFLCSLKNITSIGMHLVAFPEQTIAALELDRDDILKFADDLDRELENNAALFQV